MRTGTEHHIAAVRPAERNERLPAERRRTVAPFSGTDDYVYLVYECSCLHFKQTDVRRKAGRPPLFALKMDARLFLSLDELADSLVRAERTLRVELGAPGGGVLHDADLFDRGAVEREELFDADAVAVTGNRKVA